MAFIKVTGKVGGFAKLEKELHALKTKGFRMAKKAARSGAEVIVNKVREFTPVDTDHLRPSIGTTMEVDAGNFYIQAIVAPRRGYKWFGVSTGWRGQPRNQEPRIYGGYQERGFYHVLVKRNIQGKFFMKRGLHQGRLGALSRIRATMRALLREELG